MTKPVLTYFSSRGKAELIRLILAESGLGVDYEEVNVGVWHPTDKTDAFKELVKSGTLAFNSLPSYSDDEVFLVQSSAIVRYLAKKFGLNGSNLKEESLIDQFAEGVSDLVMIPRTAFNVMYPVQQEVTSETLENSMEKILLEKIPHFLTFFERALEGKIFLVGDKISYADISLFYALDIFLELWGEYFTKQLSKLQNLKHFHQRIKSREGIQNHLNNPKRFPKQPFPGYDKVLSHLH